MLVRETKRLILLVGPLVIIFYFGLRLCLDRPALPEFSDWFENSFSPNTEGDTSQNSQVSAPTFTPSSDQGTIDFGSAALGPIGNKDDPFSQWNEVYSVSTQDRKYFKIQFGDRQAMNPNIIPHPLLENTWIIVAQQYKTLDEPREWFTELICNAEFVNDVLLCTAPPSTLPIAATSGGKCSGDLEWFEFNVGPHDARVFFGPKVPYTIYGSNSRHTCFGQWIQDFRVLVPWGLDMVIEAKYHLGTELQRPLPWSPVEKNWFVFWDRDEQAYIHYDVAPQRVFAKLGDDGSVGSDMAPLARFNDEKCMAKHMPQDGAELESIHQATNSLSITLCKRSDTDCEPSDANTVIIAIFQHKTYYSYHSVYWPYLMVFRQQAPFELYGISKKSIYIHGREMTLDMQSEMFYVTSMSWKARGQKYHGYVDDVVFLAFGIEDKATGGVDVTAGDLFKSLGLCSEA